MIITHCIHEGCVKLAAYSGLCAKHRKQQTRSQNPIDKIYAKVVIDPVSHCHLWQGAKYKDGYGRMSFLGVVGAVHRIVYERTVSAIGVGNHIHHTCGNRNCVNPAHLCQVSKEDHNKIHLLHDPNTGRFIKRAQSSERNSKG